VSRQDVASLVRLVEQALALNRLEDAIDDVLVPTLVAVGDGWATGDLTVAHEHLATGIVRAQLEKLLADVRSRIRGTAVLACAPGEQHEVGLLMLAVLLRADGWAVSYLGPDTPTADAFGLATDVDASALLFSATCEGSARVLEGELGRMRIPDGLEVIVGGRAVDGCSATELVATLH
jgi:methanogenic corrinoid protein MtbC1